MKVRYSQIAAVTVASATSILGFLGAPASAAILEIQAGDGTFESNLDLNQVPLGPDGNPAVTTFVDSQLNTEGTEWVQWKEDPSDPEGRFVVRNTSVLLGDGSVVSMPQAQDAATSPVQTASVPAQSGHTITYIDAAGNSHTITANGRDDRIAVGMEFFGYTGAPTDVQSFDTWLHSQNIYLNWAPGSVVTQQ